MSHLKEELVNKVDIVESSLPECYTVYSDNCFPLDTACLQKAWIVSTTKRAWDLA